MRSTKLVLALFIMIEILCAGLASAQGGPPMVTDDPGTVPDRHWEINIASIGSMTPNQSLFQFPYFDANYGVGERLQLKVETGWVVSKQAGMTTQSGDGTLLVGTKFRFLDEEKFGIAVSTYPQFLFHPSFASKTDGLNVTGNQLILPLEFSKAFGDWEINPDLGYVYSNQVSDEIFYGAVLAYEKLKPFEPLFEIHATTLMDHMGTATLLNFGFRYTFNPMLNLIAALGHTITHYDDLPTEMDSYVGVQLEL